MSVKHFAALALWKLLLFITAVSDIYVSLFSIFLELGLSALSLPTIKLWILLKRLEQQRFKRSDIHLVALTHHLNGGHLSLT